MLNYYAENGEEGTGFLCHFPWLFDTQSKSEVLLFDSAQKMKGAVNTELINNFFSGAPHNNYEFAFLNLEIRRDHLVEDALNNLLVEGLNF